MILRIGPCTWTLNKIMQQQIISFPNKRPFSPSPSRVPPPSDQFKRLRTPIRRRPGQFQTKLSSLGEKERWYKNVEKGKGREEEKNLQLKTEAIHISNIPPFPPFSSITSYTSSPPPHAFESKKTKWGKGLFNICTSSYITMQPLLFWSLNNHTFMV